MRRGISWVKVARILCLSAIIVILTWLMYQQQISSSIAGIKIAATSVLKASKSKISTPRLSGFDKSGQPYEITAELAEQISNPLVKFSYPRANLSLHNSKEIQIEAKTGFYNEKSHLLALQGQVKLETNKDEHVIANKATINLATGTIISNDRVTIVTGDSKITSNGFTMTNDGILHFGGSGQMTITPQNIGKKK